MFAALLELLGTEAFMPHGHCYLWTPGLLWLMVGSDLLIAFAYFTIPLLLLYFVRKRPDIPFPHVFVLFGAFIVLCGLTHVFAAITTWHPAYWLEAGVKAATGVVSVATAITLVPILPQALALRSPAELERANEELARLNEELLGAQQARVEAAALRRVNEELEILAGAVSHDLRAPLRGIKRAAEFLRREGPATPPAEHTEWLDLLYSRTERLDRMLRGLLDYYRAGLDRAEPTMVDLEALLDRVVTLVEPPERFTLEIDLQVPTARLPEPPIVQVLVNLLSNAIRHHDRDEGNIRVTVARDPDGVVLEVRDDGPGIADHHQERVFEALRTLRPRDEVDTPGIGLALVKRVVERHGGRVSLTSTSGEGSTFTVHWPEGTYMGVTPSLLDPASG